MRDIQRAARELPTPAPPDGALGSILARHEAGERVLTLEGCPELDRRRYSGRAVATAASVILLALAAVVFWPAAELGADRSMLFTSPENPQAGDRIEIEYRATAEFDAHDRLVLRQRYRTPDDHYYGPEGGRTVPATELERGRDGRFRGSFTLPDSAVYAVLAVEDAEGAIVDSNQRAFWELLAHNANGTPEFEALVQRRNDLSQRNWELALSTVRDMTELYPESVEAWSNRAFTERQLVGSEGLDSLSRDHQRQFRRLDRGMGNGVEPNADNVAWMSMYAHPIGLIEESDRWEERLKHEHPRHPLAVMYRVVDIFRAHEEDFSQRLRELEALWEEVGPVHAQLLDEGLRSAVQAGEPEPIRRWAERNEAYYPAETVRIAMWVAEFGGVEAGAADRLRRELTRLGEARDADRPLHQTVEEHQAASRAEAQPLFAALGKLLIEAGDTAAAVDTLNLAMEPGWDQETFRQVGELRLSVADTAGALDAFAMVAVDPHTDGAFADSVATLTGGRDSPEDWSPRLEDAGREMRSRTLAGATTGPVNGDARLLDGDGGRGTLGELADGDVTVVAFWSRWCGPAIDALPRMRELHGWLESRGARMVTITGEAPSADLYSFLGDRGVRGLPVYHDTEGEARETFNQWATPEYFVLDSSGRVRFEYSDFEDIPRQVEALKR